MKSISMKIALTAGYLCVALLVFGQNRSEALIGKWAFEEIYQSEKLDSAGVAMLKGLFGGMTFQFSDGGLYKAEIMGKEEQGKWELVDEKNVSLASDKGVVSPMELLEVSENRLAFTLQRTSFVMAKLPDSEMEVLAEPTAAYPLISATVDQVTKKWTLKSKESLKDKSELVDEVMNELYKSTYIDLKASGKYESQIMGIGEKASWEFGENNETIIISGDEGKRVWSIVAVTYTELTLILGVANEKWVFKSN